MLSSATPLRSNKRSSSSSLDCVSLQSSLKRVRLSCSPGELRLQRDLLALPSYGWRLLPSGGECNDVWDSHPKWLCANAELQMLDPLRLKLTMGQCRVWIQIPRMYPHKPPTITRTENTETLWIRDVPRGEDNAMPGYSLHHTMEWSPIRQIGDLLSCLLQRHDSTAQTPSIPSSTNSSRCSSRSATPLHSFHVSDDHCSVSTMSSISTNGRNGFIEEHKMDDVAPFPPQPSRNDSDIDIVSQALMPNRFHTGYGKYENPLDSSSSRSSRRTEDPNAMEF